MNGHNRIGDEFLQRRVAKGQQSTFSGITIQPMCGLQLLTRDTVVSPQGRIKARTMDPLSLAASAITIAALATDTCRAFAGLRALCRTLSGRLHALSNDVTDINVVLIHVATVFQERASAVEDEQQHTTSHLLELADRNWNFCARLSENWWQLATVPNSQYSRPTLGARNSQN